MEQEKFLSKQEFEENHQINYQRPMFISKKQTTGAEEVLEK